MKNIFVLGSDEFNLSLMKTLASASDYCFHVLFDYDEVRMGVGQPVPILYKDGLAKLKSFPGSVDAIVGYWDFPVSTLLPLLCQPFNLPSPSFEALLKCEHKYWSRLEQRRVIPEYIPDFCVVDPFGNDPGQQISLPFPYWLKPVKAASSQLGFMVRNVSERQAAIEEIQQKIARFAEPFNYLMQFAELPDEVKAVDGNYCIAEAIISNGQQCTLEGYVYHSRCCVYGTVDSIREGEHNSSFSRYQYPSTLPPHIQQKMISVTERFLQHIGFDNGPFNIEYYWDSEADRIWLLEVNARISKSHCPLFNSVDGMSHHQVMLDLALGKEPDFPHRQGPFRYAAKFMWRVHSDAVVVKVPSEQQIQAVIREFPGCEIKLHIHEGMRLSDLINQDSYSYEIAVVFIGGDSEHELLEKYHNVKQALDLELSPLPCSMPRDEREGKSDGGCRAVST
ncbi:ATP-grasp domain-containing protein [uncultured Photobacterium sp.]|uniref:ATP-grasp domain-containing protein n=1 Tax=uncultured Photobacterium sp. TaxID=173973 RepID=UPI0026280855|nr:ATP-grasp domain-containing protein [uncultured Photobacterium sp.]